MTTPANPPFVLHEHKHQYPDSHRRHKHQPRFPTIPDLRFERSYLKSIQPYVNFHRTGESEVLSHSFVDVEADDEDKDEEKPSPGPSEVIDIQWGHVFWVTTRDQVLSPLLQGTLWAIISFYLTPISVELGRSLHEKRRVIKEGLGVGWLRSWVQNLGLRQPVHDTGKR
ncbi:hypothetical protein WG66_010820 [Moniliophthora roreri]|uniref:Uncharacterized protein n=1 Tax=Moniliophthora roreri TaxID=221103 RepID=A0A0W0G9L1_MONRR|nr:hypothetical protein WG66_010820 [Moniliophthora roreri]